MGDDAAPARGMQGHRIIWLIAGVAVLSLVAGVLLSRFIVSPNDAAAKAEPPSGGPITVPVENRVIQNDVVLRADVLYDEAVDVRIDTSEFSGAPVVTGGIPEVGKVIENAAVMLEIAGRPVIALPGSLPAYRTLRAGVAGPDVLQLKQALVSLGIDPGNAESDLYDAKTAAAVDKLYVAVGYESPPSSTEALDAVDAARDALADAKTQLTSADVALVKARAGATQVQLIEADNAVNAATRARQNPEEGADLVSLDEALAVAVAQRDALRAPADTTEETATRTSASQAVTKAQQDLDAALSETLTGLPASEVAYFSSLPRRVNAVQVDRGDQVETSVPVLSVSGATLVVQGTVSATEAPLLSAGLVGSYELPDGTTTTATILEVTKGGPSAADAGTEGEDTKDTGAGQDGLFTVTFTPDALTPEQIEALQGTNIRIVVPVSSTNGEVLAVPSAALTAGPSGESRVERQTTGDASELVTVVTGLAADGYVEIVSSDVPLTAEDLVVVGG